jgi:2-polyprenyl-3-methyl-5-hydroxy-6-metoxy-1,4-benzoquinol methylase
MVESCSLCGASISKPEVMSDFVYGGKEGQKFYSCPECEAAFLYPPMSQDEESRFYAQEFEKFMEKRAGKDFDWSGPEAHIKSNEKQLRRRLRFFEEFIAAGKRVLEIGCSSGFMLLPLKEAGLEVVGVEPSDNFTDFLKRHGISVYRSLEDIDESQKNKFDLVMHFFVLEHVRKPIDFLKSALEFVAPGGVMIFEVPSRSDPLITVYNIPAFQKFYWSAAHHFYYNRRSLVYILRNVSSKYEILLEQRYDLSNHITWAMEGKPGGQGRYSSCFTSELEKAYLDSMVSTGYCDTLVCRIYK